ncbi:hypothetical protein CDD83_5380 [Cordyceps sp. RAO-2017]|nr:hypothetical protein CDD83_5380 [Cordyceps sp. RAO-2017]
MRTKWLFALFLPCLASGLQCIKSAKTCKVLNPDDSRFLNYRKAGPNDSRSPCPALNALANHGFLPRDGRNLGMGQIVCALFEGLGVDPVVSIFILAFAYAASNKPLCFTIDLEDLASHRLAIEHDCSFSRDDWKNGIGNNRDFNPEIWKVAYDELSRSYGKPNSPPRTHINFITLGRAKAARAKDAKRRNPDSQWDPRAWFNGYTEHGLVLSAFSDSIPGFARLCVIKTLFEEERLPWLEGWRPAKFRLNLVTMVVIGTLSILGDSMAFTTMWNVLKGEPMELLEVFIPPKIDHFPHLVEMVGALGFDTSGIEKAVKTMTNIFHKRKRILPPLDQAPAKWGHRQSKKRGLTKHRPAHSNSASANFDVVCAKAKHGNMQSFFGDITAAVYDCFHINPAAVVEMGGFILQNIAALGLAFAVPIRKLILSTIGSLGFKFGHW